MSETPQLIEKQITVSNPVDGSPLTINLSVEVQMPDCNCTPRVTSPGNPPGWQPRSHRR
ncbi:hypothetical protein SAMN04489751_1793 [Brevibacterium sandarakinum]|uniref:Uncharacterized protein n=1 Tax=Brevibacterium sandarakinum TaxID=629680 RepID=A0A1H1RET0_BRESA|nr:hypothetical protein [Brevibacterium sandarakinum]SDS34200.1 hypothetical protein SAMN04489751_1793 [Brevibacterium sandarakinum]